MKRGTFLRHLKNHGCVLLREGGRHSVWMNPKTRKKESIPRHSEIDNDLAKHIYKKLSVSVIGRP